MMIPVMPVLSAPFVAALLAITVASPVAVARTNVSATSSRLAAQGDMLVSQGQPANAVDFYETALVADPKNVAAFVGLGKAYEKQGLTGKALSFYRKALVINPNDLGALEAQGLAMIAKGQLAKAQASLDRLRRICRSGCVQKDRLEAAVAAAQAKNASARNNARPASRTAARKPTVPMVPVSSNRRGG
jgi:tetratricopeptide (TPR) repeat protein